MALGIYHINQRVRLSAVFTVGVVETDPSTITMKHRPQGGAITTLVFGVDSALQRSAQGRYFVDLKLTLDGSWWYRFEGTGACEAAEENELFVRKSQF